ncbi:MAG: hypothetical protein ACE5FD_19280, partial [Anaerolineae bacterium]
MKSRSLTIYWLVIAATLWAAFSRFHLIAALPPQAWVDEAWIALHARKLLQTGQVYVYYKTFWGGMHPFMVHLTALIQAAGFDSLITSRAISTVAGVLTVPLAFACFDELWRGVWPAPRRLTAAFTALILSNLLYTVVVSRVGYEPALIPVPMLFFVWQMRRAQRTGRWSSWIAAGLVLGLTQYVSHHARFLILLVVTLALHDLVCLRPSAWHGEDSPAVQRRRLIIGLGVCAAAAILVALPLIVFFVREPEWMLARGRAVTAIPRQTGASFLLENLKLILLSFNFGGDVNPRRNLPGRPMFDCIQSAGLWVGIVWSVLRFRRVAPARDLLAWLAIMTLPSIITDEAPQFERMIGAAAPAAALVAIGWVTLWQWVGQWLERLRADGTKAHRLPVRGWPALLLVLVSLGLNTYDYYGRYPTTPGLSAAFTTTPVRLARQLIERARSEPVFVERITEAGDVFAFAFLFPGTPVRRLDFRQCLP